MVRHYITLIQITMNEIGLYVPSYKRWDAILTNKLLPQTTYVVRETQEEKYREAGIKSIWAVEDEKINSWSNVMNYIVDNAKENLIAILDDDITGFFHVTDDRIKIECPHHIENELQQALNVMEDLDIGFGALFFVPDPKRYSREISFAGTLGSVYLFNRKKVKGRFNNEASAVADAEFELQELLHNRIVYLPQWIRTTANLNKGVNTQNRDSAKIRDSALWTNQKWGSHFKYDLKKNKTEIKVKR